MSRALLRLALLTVAFALASFAFGWWAVPAVALAWGVMSGGAPRAALRAGVAAALAWALLLVVPGLGADPVFAFGVKLAGAMQVPVAALWIVELGFPLAAAWSAALLGSALRVAPRRRDSAALPQ